MEQNEQGMLYPFRISGSRLRQRAQQLRRYGQTLDALALVRRAAEQEDTPAGWMALAEELLQTHNWEAAVPLLARVMSRDPEHPTLWLAMARCLHALGQTETALDCAYHQLRVAPWSNEGDAARELIAQLEPPEKAHESRRSEQLIQRALAAWQSGDRPLGERRINRALRLTDKKQSLLASIAMLCMMSLDLSGALKYLTRALRCDPRSTRTLAALSTLYVQLGRPRMARGLLRQAGQCAVNAVDEDSVLTAAWAQNAWGEMRAYLAQARRETPWRTTLMSAEANMLLETGRPEAARALWKDVIAVNPDDRNAAVMLTADEALVLALASMPKKLITLEGLEQMTELRSAAEAGESLLRIGERNRRLLDWFLASGEAEERECAMTLLERCEGSDAIANLKELLCRPFLRAETRHWALVRLAEMGCTEPVAILMGQHYSIIACRKTNEQGPVRPWRNFLRTLLAVTRKRRQSTEIVAYAAEIWRSLPEPLRQQAGDEQCYTWCIAMEALYLMDAGEEDSAVRVVRDSHLPARRVSRVLRRMHRCLMQDNIQPELENGDT